MQSANELSTKGTIPDEALVTLTSKKYLGERKPADGAVPSDKSEGDCTAGNAGEGYESDEDEVDEAALKRGELEG